MPVSVARLSQLKQQDLAFDWQASQSSFYATSVGMGREQSDRLSLAYTNDNSEQRVVPTMACVMSVNVFDQPYGWQLSQMLHGEQRLQVHRPLSPSVRLVADFSVSHIHDKGPDKPAILMTTTHVRDRDNQAPLFTAVSTLVARADGGFGGPQDELPTLAPVPTRSPDLEHTAQTRPEQASLYRHNGDHNPLHFDPAVARAAGFDRPILHGLCTYGFACSAILKTVCQYDNTLIRQFDARFSAPVYPGDTIVTQMWQSADIVAFRCVVPERDQVVLDRGMCRLAVQ
ncbi:MAG: MaoC/PaaZ C-terminal domain-containing protein [Pseudomonadota bacterium]